MSRGRILTLLIYGAVFICLIFRVAWILGRRCILKRMVAAIFNSEIADQCIYNK